MKAANGGAVWVRVLLTAVFLGNGGCAGTVIFRDHHIFLPVFVAADAPPPERQAAEELGRVLSKMSGLSWPVRIADHTGEPGFYVGHCGARESSRSALRLGANLLVLKPGEVGPDTFRIYSRKGQVFIEGATPEATGYAVSWLLQQEGGVRWYAPGEDGEIVPRRDQWILPTVRVVRAPAYVSREITGFESPEGRAWARHNGLGGHLEFGHALSRVFEIELHKNHPEWFPLLDGERYVPKSNDDQSWQPNIAMPALSAHAAEVAKQAFRLDEKRLSFSLGINDTVRFDQSEETQKWIEPLHYFRGKPDYSSLVFAFTNRVASFLSPAEADRYLGCLAYFWCENTPPFSVNSHLVPFVATDRTQYYDPEYRAADLALMSRWGKSGAAAFGLWEYAYGRNFIIPRQPLTVLADALRQGWRRGARGYFAELEPQPGFDAFKAWMLAQLTWDPERKVEDLKEDFFPGYFGPAAAPMRRFFERCEVQWMAQPKPAYWLKYYGQEDQARLFPVEVCRSLRAELTEAGRAASADSVAAARVRQTSRAFAVTEAYVEFDQLRRSLAAIAESDGFGDESGLSALIAQRMKAETELRRTLEEAQGGEHPALQANLAEFVRNDPVPLLLWRVGERDSLAPRRILNAAGSAAMDRMEWRGLAQALADQLLPAAPNLIVNGSFMTAARERQEPRYLYPRFGTLPAHWMVHAMPTETGYVARVGTELPGSTQAVRIEGAWNTQLYQWLPADAGGVYVLNGQLRGKVSEGSDSALYLTFLDASGQTVGARRMQSLPKGVLSKWSPLVLADVAPRETAWVGVGVTVSRQVMDDWVEVGSLAIRRVILTTP